MSKFKKNKAAALKYNMEEDTAPVVIASGYGPMAEKIIDIAEQKGIPVFKDDSAASLCACWTWEPTYRWSCTR